MSGERYYYLDGLKTIGPLSRSIILKLYANRTVRRDTVARRESSSEWVPMEALLPEEALREIDQRGRGASRRAALCLLWCVPAWFAWVGFDQRHLSLVLLLYFGVLLILTGVFVVIAARFARQVFGEVRSVMPKYLSRATLRGLVQFQVFFVMSLAKLQVQIAHNGCQVNGQVMGQFARNL